MELGDTYYTIKDRSEGLYKEKGSKFLSFAFPVESEDEVKARLEELKKKYFDARHHCYAYILGEESDRFRAYDDGEPGHSAGDPILGQIRSHDLTFTLIVVVRYFGGTKLGVGGLINAYKTAASEAISNNRIVEQLILAKVRLRFEYAELNQVMKLVKDLDLSIISQNMEMTCEMSVGVRKSLKKELHSRLNALHKITIL